MAMTLGGLVWFQIGLMRTKMNNRSRLVSVLCSTTLTLCAGQAFAQLRVAAWNISHYAGGRVPAIQAVTYGVNSANGLSLRPDIILLQEIADQASLNAMVSALNTASGSPGDWAAATFDNGPDWDNAMVYRTGKVQFLGRVQVVAGGVSPLPPRNTHRYNVRPVGYTAASTMIGMYSSHMKAQESGTDDDARRLAEVVAIRNDAEALPAGWNFLFGGDTNIQTSSVADYQEFVGSQANNAGRFFDPINRPGSWNNNASFAFIHTQDPSGAGGMDDRHDQILISGSLMDGAGIDYIGNPAIPASLTSWNDPNHSYRAWGNDGTSIDAVMTTTGNTMVGPTIAQGIIDCAEGGGHIPVFLDLKMPAKITTSTTTINFGQVPQNASATQNVTVTHAGNTGLWTVAGLQSLTFTFAASAGFTAPAGSFNRTPGSTGSVHAITMNTSTLGVKNGTITITSNDPDQPTRIINVTGEVVASNTPPVANAGPDQNVTDADGNGAETITFNGSASTDNVGITNYQWNEGVTTLTQGASATQNAALAVGSHTITLTVFDSALLSSTDQMVVVINPQPCPANIDDGTGTGTPDGGIDISDLLYFLGQFEAGSSNADLDDGTGSGTPDNGVDISDLLFFLGHFEAGC
jgi:hypothetical protein